MEGFRFFLLNCIEPGMRLLAVNGSEADLEKEIRRTPEGQLVKLTVKRCEILNLAKYKIRKTVASKFGKKPTNLSSLVSSDLLMATLHADASMNMTLPPAEANPSAESQGSQGSQQQQGGGPGGDRLTKETAQGGIVDKEEKRGKENSSKEGGPGTGEKKKGAPLPGGGLDGEENAGVLLDSRGDDDPAAEDAATAKAKPKADDPLKHSFPKLIVPRAGASGGEGAKASGAATHHFLTQNLPLF